MKALRVGLASLIVMALVPAAAAAGAEQGSTAVCTGTWKVDFSPGITGTVQRSRFTTAPSVLTCIGRVRGHEVTGPGSFTQEGTTEGTLLTGSGGGREWLRVPTTGGEQTVSFTYTLEYGPGLGLKFGDSLAGPYTFVFAPSRGDGVLAPVTQIAATGWFVLES
ncbi:MAG: hypothetical protein ACRDJO_00930 [Actinomycetota bacterium]